MFWSRKSKTEKWPLYGPTISSENMDFEYEIFDKLKQKMRRYWKWAENTEDKNVTKEHIKKAFVESCQEMIKEILKE